MALLVQFLLRLTFGLALGMLLTSSRQVTSGYFRNHLYVTLGLAALAALLSFSVSPDACRYALAAAICSYLGSVYWLFEKPAPGKLMLLVVTVTALLGASAQVSTLSAVAGSAANTISPEDTAGETVLTNTTVAPTAVWLGLGSAFWSQAAVVSSSLLLGFTMAAMLLGHWYLNTPTMELVPLRRLILAMGAAVTLQAVLSTLGLWGEIAATGGVTLQWILFVALRWTFGLVGVAAMAWMAWQTLKIPNTQSATGILYVAVIGTFVGETMALLLSTESLFPL